MKKSRLLIALCLTVPALAADNMTNRPSVFSPAEIAWKPGPASLPPGAMMAVLEGDPAAEGPFVLRVKFPDKYRIQPHWHPKTERVTVMAGALHLGMGEKFDAAATQSLPAGTFGHWPAQMRHFAWVEGETILQLHGIGPWQIVYVNPEDDPRNEKH